MPFNHWFRLNSIISLEMSAFNFNLRDEDGKCVSQNDATCTYEDGSFCFDQCEMSVGNSYENNYGGIGGFVGPNHEYFLYCGSKYPEIAVVKHNKEEDEWEHHACLQWMDFDDEDEDGYFKGIWFTKEEALIFEPKSEHRYDLMQHRDLGKGKACIKLDLPTGKFIGLTRKMLNEQKHSILDENSQWPLDSRRSSSSCTLAEIPRSISNIHPYVTDVTQPASASAILSKTFKMISDCFGEASKELSNQVTSPPQYGERIDE